MYQHVTKELFIGFDQRAMVAQEKPTNQPTTLGLDRQAFPRNHPFASSSLIVNSPSPYAVHAYTGGRAERILSLLACSWRFDWSL